MKTEFDYVPNVLFRKASLIKHWRWRTFMKYLFGYNWSYIPKYGAHRYTDNKLIKL